MPDQRHKTTQGDRASVSSVDSVGKKKSFRRLFVRFAEKTSMQGVPYINMAKFWWAKAIWALMLLAAIAAMLLHLWYLFDQWYSWPKTTKITLGFDDLDLPQVTICNNNPLIKGKLDHFERADELKQLIEDLEPEHLAPEQFDDDYDPTAQDDSVPPPNGNSNMPPANSGGGTNTQQPPVGTTTKPPLGPTQEEMTPKTETQPPPNSGSGPTQPPPNSGSGTTKPPPNSGSGTTKPPPNSGSGTTKPPPNSGSGTTKPPPNSGSGTTKPPPNSGSGTTKPPPISGNGTTKPPPNSGSGTTKPPPNSGSGTTKAPPNSGSGTTKPPPNSGSGTTKPPPNSGSGTTKPPPNSGSGTTKPPPNSGSGTTQLSPGSEAETTKPLQGPGNQSPPPSTGNGSQMPSSPPSSPPVSPSVRRKRFVDSYDEVNLTKYNEDYLEQEEALPPDFNANMDSWTQLRNLFTKLYMDLDSKDRANMGHQIDDMLIDCTFSGRTCTADMFSLHQTSEYGNCWTIRTKNFRVREAGPTGGLSITLFLETAEYLKGITTGYGARVQLNEAGTYPFPADEGVYIPAAMETDIALRMETVTRLSGNYGVCNDGVEFKEIYNKTYTRRACQSFCRMSRVITECNCFNDNWEELAFLRNTALRPCRKRTDVSCMNNVLREFANGTYSCTCDNPCREVVYRKSTSQRQWPTSEYARVLLQWVCKRKPIVCKKLREHINDIYLVNNNFLKLNIYYEDLNFQTVAEVEQIELQQFLSDIGGAFGLWIGLSVLSLCEVIQLFIELCDYSVHKTVKGHREERRRKLHKQLRDQGKHPAIAINGEKDQQWPSTVFAQNERFPRQFYNRSPHLRRAKDPFSHSSGYGSDDSHDSRKKHSKNGGHHKHLHPDRIHDGFPNFDPPRFMY